MPGEVPRDAGRELFGVDPAGYDRWRPSYPAGVWEVLEERCGLRAGIRALEIGSATGAATREIAGRGASVVAVEPDARLAAFLASDAAAKGLDIEVVVSALEDADLEPGGFDLAVAATSFHWMTDQHAALRKLFAALRPGGSWAMWWNVFGDPTRPDPFHVATKPVIGHLGQDVTEGPVPFPLDAEARLSDLRAAGFDAPTAEEMRWTWRATPGEVRGLYATYSPWARLPERERAELLDAIERVALEEFGGLVERPFMTTIYTARRPLAGD